MNKYLIDLAFAFQKVSMDCYKWNALNGNGNEYQQEAENNFTSEIVRHFRNLIDEPSNGPYYKNLKCHFDVRKARVHLQPDIILHESPNNRKRQELFCEVKIDPNSDLTDDLNKLTTAVLDYSDDNLNFHFGVYIIANKSLIDVKNDIRSYFEKNRCKKNIDRLYLFHGLPDSNMINYKYECFKSFIT